MDVGSYRLPGSVFDFLYLNHGLNVGVFRLHDGIKRYDVFIADQSRGDMIPVCRKMGGQVDRYVIDLPDATFVDSAASGAIIDVIMEASRNNAPETKVVVHNGEAAEIMELLHFDYAVTEKDTIPDVPGDYTQI